ncbi:Grainyhead-like protein 2 [Elsinoe australis]|uniref:Grainyhead-like protein 2 n=1 Tax=Elsinoe australis TaxID=40998 RepID=A0A2P7Z2Y6_9PEZI|nr:Grainyhead-like protein 2 [Elsinoe australis]
MFRNRTSEQKPPDGLYKDFKASFPGLRADGSPAQAAAAPPGTDALDAAPAVNPRAFTDASQHPHEMSKDGEPTPRGHVDAWGFNGSGLTPSLLDPNSHSFNHFANQLPGYYTPTPGGTNTLYHSQHAGDLHTPGFTFGLNTPLSMPTSQEGMNHGQQAMAMQNFHHQQQMQHAVPQQQQFHGMDPYQMHQQPQQQTFPPQNFQNPPAGFQHMESHSESPSMGDVHMDMGMHQSPEMLFHPDTFNNHQGPTKFPHPLSEKFRYHVTLNAPTAMVKHEDEIPITYLNKGQAYTLNVADTAPQHSAVGQLKYRTFVRISFEDPDQRKRPSNCWQLWKEGRGTNEAHLRGGKLQAVEYVDPSQMTGNANDPARAKIELECASFDGFCVTWTPSINGTIECPIPVRFNFLSTDFSHSKGVKGIPVRLCTKTELLLDSMSPNVPQAPAHEICFCKVKLFRDHGAERKLSNDVAHVKKSIEKVNQQIQQIEAGMRDLGKRKRSSAGQESQRPGKVQKHRRTWSMSSTNSPTGRTSAEDELHMKLLVLQEMFSSTRPSSILFLRGGDEDDPDLHPVRLTGEPHDLTKIESADTSAWEKQSAQSSTMVSPTPSSQSLMSAERRDSSFQHIGSLSRVASNDWKQTHQMGSIDLQSTNPQHLASPPDQPVKIQATSPTSGTLSGWIESLGVDPSYQPPQERAIKPIACFHVKPRLAGEQSEDKYYRAIYLMQRTLRDFVMSLCLKVNIEPTQVMRTIRVTNKGMMVLFDDEDIVQMREGQDMTAEFVPVKAPNSPVRPSRQWDSGATDIQVDGDLPTLNDHPSSGYELKLFF